MSTENELNENELWDLLKEPIESDSPTKKDKKKDKPAKVKEEKNPGENPQPEESKSKTIITEKRKRALVWYLVGLFGIAFVMVLCSLFLKGQPAGNGETSTVDSTQIQELYDRINELEEENTSLKAENEELTAQVMEQQEMMDGLNLMIDELTNSLEYVEGNALYSDENAELLARTMTAYQTLVRAQNAFIDYDEEVLEQAMAELEDNLDVLSNEALNAYYMVIEYMEQPYLGQE